MAYLENFYKGRGVYNPKGTQTVWIICEDFGYPYAQPWSNKLSLFLQEIGYQTRVISPQITKVDNFAFQNEIMYRAKQMEDFYYKIIENEIKNGDVFIFLNIWNPLLLMLQRYKRLKKQNSISVIGLWDDSFLGDFTQDAKKRTSINYRRDEWAVFMNFGFFKMCDFVIFRNEMQRDGLWFTKAFKKRYLMQFKNYFGYPLSLLKPDQVNRNKENLILVPFFENTDRQKILVANLRGDFKDCTVVVMGNDKPWTYENYLDLLGRAKIAINFNDELTDPEIFYEQLVHGVYPFTHNRMIKPNLLDECFKYENDLLQPPMFNVIRNQMTLWEKIRNVVDNFEDLPTKQILECEARLTETEFKSDDFVKIIKYLKYESNRE